MSRWWRGEAVASQAQAYHRSPLEPFPAERTSQRRLSFSSVVTASAQVSVVPAARVSVKFDGTRSTYAWPLASKNSRSSRAVAVHLVAAGEVERMPSAYGVRADVDGQLSLGAELQVQRQPHDQGLHRVLDVLAGDPLPGADQRVPGLLPHVGQVHRVDPVRHPARAPHVLALDPRGGLAGLFLPGLVDRPDHQAARAAVRAGPPPPARPPRTGAPRSSRRSVSQLAWFSSRWVLSGVRSPACRAMLHPFRSGSSLITAAHVLARLQPRLRPGKTRPQQRQQLSPFPQRQPGAYPDGSSRL